METTFDPAKRQISNSTGIFTDGSKNSCPYIKENNKGAVYVVTGSAGKISPTQPAYPHNAMTYSNAEKGGASLIEVNGNRLDFKWICEDGEMRDHFTILKKVDKKTIIKARTREKPTLSASFTGNYVWSTKQTNRSITVQPGKGRTIYKVKDVEAA